MRVIKDKIKTHQELKQIIPRLKRQGKRIAFTNGCFDILHSGHVDYLEQTKRLGDILVVAINSDRSVQKLKGKGRPVINLRDRMRIIAALECTDFVTSFTQDTPLDLIKLIRPDILVKGSDWDKHKIVGRDVVQTSGGRVITLPLTKGRSSTKIIKKIGKAF